MKILINTPYLSIIGGVSMHYKGLRPYWTENVRYIEVGKRRRGAKFQALLLTPYDVLKFVFSLLTFRPDIVLLNPSMKSKALKRDFAYLKIARFLGFKVVIMFHGFHSVELENKKEKIAEILNQCSLLMVLAGEFRDILVKWGVTVPIKIVTTKVDDALIKGFDINHRTGNIKNVLYLARVTKEKGIFIALNVFKELAAAYPKLTFTVVGEGTDLERAKKLIDDSIIKNLVTFTGALSGQALIDEFTRADCYLFTSYHEGMPSSVLEAMAFGLPVITRPVGGLKDFFENGKMGFFVDSDDSGCYLPVFEKLMGNPNLVKQISFYNYDFAKHNLMASSVALKMESIMKSII